MKKVSLYLGLAYAISIYVDVILSSLGLLGVESRLTNFLLEITGFLVPSLIIYLIFSLKILKLPLINRLPTYELYLAERWSYISIRVAYLWLLLSSILELISNLQLALGFDVDVGIDAIRHIQLLGFASMLVFGVGSKMLPGFIGRRQIYSGKLVIAAFWLLLLAAIFRITPVLLPYEIVEIIPQGEYSMGTMFALSGILGMLAIALFGWNLRKTKLSDLHQ